MLFYYEGMQTIPVFNFIWTNQAGADIKFYMLRFGFKKKAIMVEYIKLKTQL